MSFSSTAILNRNINHKRADAKEKIKTNKKKKSS